MSDFLKLVVLALFLLPLDPVAADPNEDARGVVFDCWQPELIFKQCAVAGPDGLPHLTPAFVPRLQYRPDGLAPIMLSVAGAKVRAQWYYTRRDGPLVPVERYDNGPDDFVHGRARSPVGGKVGYIDRNLDLVIPAIYDGAYPFEKGAAVVCLACALVSDGSHSWYEGGQWGRIDPKGDVVAAFRPWEVWKKEEQHATGKLQ